MSSSIHIWCWDSVTILIRPVIIIIVVVIIVNIIIFNLFTKSFVIDIIINSLMLIMNIIVPDYPHLYCHLHAQYPHLCPSNLHYLRHSYHCNCHNHKAFFIKDVTLLSSNVSMYVHWCNRNPLTLFQNFQWQLRHCQRTFPCLCCSCYFFTVCECPLHMTLVQVYSVIATWLCCSLTYIIWEGKICSSHIPQLLLIWSLCACECVFFRNIF